MRLRHTFVRTIAPVLGAMLISSASGYLVAAANQEVIKITAKQFEFSPASITLKKGVPVTLELTTLDMLHGFNVPELGIHSRVQPGQITRLPFVASKTGHFDFQCDSFCGAGHEDMKGEIIVTD
jgi:cytochrome c oxidase subunit II